MWEHFSEEELNVLKERAKQIQKTEDDDDLSNLIFSLLFSIGNVQYALPIETLVAVYSRVPIVAVPCVPSYIKGVANLRGHITPVVDLLQLFKLQSESSSSESHYCILAETEEINCAFYVQSIGDIQGIDIATLSNPAEQSAGAEYLQGISDDNTILINTRAILTAPSLVVDESVN